MIKDMIKTAVIKSTGTAKLIFRKHGSGAMMWVGVGGVAVTIVAACVATTKAEPILDSAKDRIDNAKKLDDASEQKKAMAAAYGAMAIDFGKLYLPATLLGTCSVSLIVGSHYILKKENVALMATTAALAESFNRYRQRVIEDQGEAKDAEYYYGIKKTKVISVDENGENPREEETCVRTAPSVSIYSRFFDETNLNFKDNGALNLMFLRRCQDEMNYLLKTRKYVFLNEVYEKLGLPRSEAGQFVGWVWNSENGDNQIDFGIYNSDNKANVDFVNGFERAVLLDFNVDGDIMYVLKPKKTQEQIEKELEESDALIFEYCRNQ